MLKNLLTGFRLVVLAGIVFLNWVLIALFLSAFGASDALAGWGAMLVEGGLVALAFTPAGEAYFRRVNRLRRPLPQEEKILRPAFERVAARCGLTELPDLFVQHSPYPNALAVGTKTVAVTQGLLQQAAPEELEAVLAHEVGHLVNGDTRVRLVAFVTNAAGSVALWVVTGLMVIISLFGFAFGSFDQRMAGLGWMVLLIAWTIKASAWALTKVLELSYLAVNRREEFAADKYAAQKGYRDALVSFLSRTQDARPEGLVAALHATHPAPEARIDRLMRLGA
ncbi:MAG: M48 family metalloprotease [Desulfotomaculales bacterium]